MPLFVGQRSILVDRYRATDFETIERQLLNLSAEDRAKLAQELLESLDQLTSLEIDALWAAEPERRWKAFEPGKMAAIPAEEVMRRARVT